MASSADVIAFRLNYPEFRAMSDADVASCLDDADVWLDPAMWAPRDFPTARTLWAAHNLEIWTILEANQEAMGDKMGFTNQTLATVSFGERRVAFKQLRGEQVAKAGVASPDDDLRETAYGKLYLMLRSRNIMPICTV